MLKKIHEKSNRLMLLLLLLALISLVVAIIKIGFVLWFWILLIIWVVIFLLNYYTNIFKVSLYFWIVFGIWFIFSFLLSFGVLFDVSDNSSSPHETVSGIVVSDCTSTIADTPQPLDGFKAAIYSAPLLSDSPNPDQANNIRTFSLSGIKNETESNSMYIRIEKTIQNEYISGYDTAMEVCNENNKANSNYVTINEDTPIANDIVASVHYLHGGSYLMGAGTYRIDAYIKDLAGKWHLVNRVSDITVTE